MLTSDKNYAGYRSLSRRVYEVVLPNGRFAFCPSIRRADETQHDRECYNRKWERQR